MILLGCLLKVLLVLDSKTVADAQKLFLPVEATEYVQANHPQGPMFNSYNWGGYLMFRLPDYPVFADGRTDLYGDTFLTGEYVRAATGSLGWQDILNQYGVKMVFMEKDSGLSQILRNEPDWKVVHEDDLAVIFVRE
ncbi:MAG: hypothetical protein JNM70_26870 [Anaerolineae bacterium]|nr:hypothetical protein [Anaerolineae bacterium]